MRFDEAGGSVLRTAHNAAVTHFHSNEVFRGDLIRIKSEEKDFLPIFCLNL